MAWDRTKAFLAEWVGTRVYTALCHSLRLSVAGDERLEELRRRHGSACFPSWHSQQLVPLFHHRHTGGVVLVSEHADGELIARVLGRLGYTCVRGSTTHGAARALMRLVKMMREGCDVGITPDGPLGPRYVVQPGVVYLAQKAGAPVVPMGFASSRYWEFRSWDRFRVPKPWSRARLVYGEPIHVPREVSGQEVERWRLRVEQGLKEATRRAEEAVGLDPEAT
ncbi:MAG: lysophospholipid acyltransferase family protein [Candidatus Brocadiia bacterium]